VAELNWDDFASEHICRILDEATSGRGRELYVMAALLHDVGKATPAFQLKGMASPELVAPVQMVGLSLPPSLRGKPWPHGNAGAFIVRRALQRHRAVGLEWLSAVIQGHHGRFGKTPVRAPRAHGDSNWTNAQDLLVESVTSAFGISLDNWSVGPVSRGVQMAVSGFVMMADWIASGDGFPGLGLDVEPTVEQARERAARAWQYLDLRGRWNLHEAVSDRRAFQDRFGYPPRPLQASAVEMAMNMHAPGFW
jgi:CRISPR-associated endonuclease/helicase Cas3